MTCVYLNKVTNSVIQEELSYSFKTRTFVRKWNQINAVVTVSNKLVRKESTGNEIGLFRGVHVSCMPVHAVT